MFSSEYINYIFKCMFSSGPTSLKFHDRKLSFLTEIYPEKAIIDECFNGFFVDNRPPVRFPSKQFEQEEIEDLPEPYRNVKLRNYDPVTQLFGLMNS